MTGPVDVSDPVESVEQIESFFVARCEEIDGIEAALDHEPETLPARPCVTMLYVSIEQDDTETGPSTDNTWGWRVNVYVDLGGTRSYRDAQRDLKRLVPRVLKVVRDDQRLGDTTLRATIRDEGNEPEFDHGAGLLWKSLRLEALVEET